MAIPNRGVIYKISLIPPLEKRKDTIVSKQPPLISEKTESLLAVKLKETTHPVAAKKIETPKLLPLEKKQNLSVPQKIIPKTAPIVKKEKTATEILSHHTPNTTSTQQVKRSALSPHTLTPEAKKMPPAFVVQKFKPGDSLTIIAPYPVYSPSPFYPSRAIRMKIQGRVVLGVEIHASGVPGKIKIQTSSGYAILDNAALEILQKWRFSPAFQGGKAVASFLEIPIVFQPGI